MKRSSRTHYACEECEKLFPRDEIRFVPATGKGFYWDGLQFCGDDCEEAFFDTQPFEPTTKEGD